MAGKYIGLKTSTLYGKFSFHLPHCLRYFERSKNDYWRYFEKDKLTAVDLKGTKYEVLNVINKDKNKIILAKGDKSYLVIDGRFKNMFFPSLEEAEEYIESKK